MSDTINWLQDIPSNRTIAFLSCLIRYSHPRGFLSRYAIALLPRSKPASTVGDKLKHQKILPLQLAFSEFDSTSRARSQSLVESKRNAYWILGLSPIIYRIWLHFPLAWHIFKSFLTFLDNGMCDFFFLNTRQSNEKTAGLIFNETTHIVNIAHTLVFWTKHNANTASNSQLYFVFRLCFPLRLHGFCRRTEELCRRTQLHHAKQAW